MPLHNLTKWSSLKGFNYQPGYSAHLQVTWTDFDPAVWEREVPWSLRFGTNTLRVWLDWSAYLVLGDKLMDHIDRALSILDRNGIQMMPVLFNRWTDARYPAGGVADNDLTNGGLAFEKFYHYIDDLMVHFADDRRIVCWDLCNEPQAPRPMVDIAYQELRWLSVVADRVRRQSDIPITIGSTVTDNVALFAPLVDVISFHPYPRRAEEMDDLCQQHIAIAHTYDRPLICTETCVGSLDDQERGELARETIETLEEYDIGWLAWQLVAGPFVSGNRQRVDSNSIRPNEGYMPFVLEDGSTRPGHEWLVKRGTETVGTGTVSIVRSRYDKDSPEDPEGA